MACTYEYSCSYDSPAASHKPRACRRMGSRGSLDKLERELQVCHTVACRVRGPPAYSTVVAIHRRYVRVLLLHFW